MLYRFDGAERYLIDVVDATQARRAVGAFAACEWCPESIPLAGQAGQAARLYDVCERAAGRAAPA